MKVSGITGGDVTLRAALAGAGLPVDDLAEPGRLFFAFRDEAGECLGYGGIEPLGEHALLRSVVVDGGRRGLGAGRHILNWLSDRAKGSGAVDAWMLTTTEAAFGEACGFQRVERANVPSAIQGTRQFAALCPSSAIVLHKQLHGLLHESTGRN